MDDETPPEDSMSDTVPGRWENVNIAGKGNVWRTTIDGHELQVYATTIGGLWASYRGHKTKLHGYLPITLLFNEAALFAVEVKRQEMLRRKRGR